MANPIMEALNRSNPSQTSNPTNNEVLASAIGSIKNMMGMLRSASNPQLVMDNIAKNNPALGSVMKLIGGRNPQEVFYEQCQKTGVDPNVIINQLR